MKDEALIHGSSPIIAGATTGDFRVKNIQPATPPAHRILLSVNQFCEKYPAFPVGGVRNLIFLSEDRRTSVGVVKGNGLKTALIRIGRKILIDEAKFFEWLDAQQGGAK